MSARTFKSGVVVSVVALLAIARGSPASANSNQCNNGQLQCCNQVFNSNDPLYGAASGLLGILGIVNDVVGGIGLSCTPINVLGLGNGAVCQQQAVCCDRVEQNGLINLGCSPVNVNL